MLLLEDNLLTKAIDPNCLAKASTWTGNDCMWVSEGNRGTGSLLVKFRAWVRLSTWSSVGGVLIAWPWCHVGFTCRACPSRSLLSGHQLSGATLQTLLWGLQESSRIWNLSELKLKAGVRSNFSCTLASPWNCLKNHHPGVGFSLPCRMLLKQLTKISITP